MFTNRLADATSPYLLQHAHNPVDWYPWGPEAIARARDEDTPIFLSIGYSACHWCHVMEREVFENAEIAAFMNEHFINIKVDREERPDLDDLYMLATQIMSGSGGWPMSVWLTPTLEPFYAGTYFPPNDAYGRPAFPRLERALADAWKNRRPDLLDQAQKVVEAIRLHTDESAGGTSPPDAQSIDAGPWIAAAIEQSADRFDRAHGGLGGAPKFPPHQALQLWLSTLERAEFLSLSHANQVLLREMITGTLDGMMRGGIYDHVGGGFARYSTDERWLVPHFEKMLYDNAQLAPAYARAAAILHRPDYARIARQTLDFWLREMTADSGAFYSSLDADSEGAEGKFYVWTPADIRAAVQSEDDARFLMDYFGLTDQSNWHESPVDGASVLAQGQSWEALAQNYGISPDAATGRLDALREKLRDYRAKRPAPGLDDKVLTSWNALMISGLAICGRLLAEPRYIAAARRAADFLLTTHVHDQHLLRVSRQGKAHTDAFLDDHAYLLNALMDLAEAGIDLDDHATGLATALLQDFQDAQRGGFFFTGPASRHEQLFARMKHAADNATPSANGMAIRALFRLGDRTGNEEYRAAAQRAVLAFSPAIERRSEYFPTILQSLVESASSDAARNDVDSSTSSSRALGEEPSVFHLAGSAQSVSSRSFQIVLHFTIAAGYHVDPAMLVARIRGSLPTFTPQWIYPPPSNKGYAGTFEIRAECAVPPDEKIAPGRYILRATIEAQPCSDIACLASQALTVEIPLTVQ